VLQVTEDAALRKGAGTDSTDRIWPLSGEPRSRSECQVPAGCEASVSAAHARARVAVLHQSDHRTQPLDEPDAPAWAFAG
jgi:hypothetical protein